MSVTDQNPVNKVRLRPTTYSIAVYIVALFILAEIVMLGGIFWFRQTKVQLETTAAPVMNKLPTLNTTAPDVTIPNLPKPDINGRINVVPQNEKITKEVTQLNSDAQKFRQNGDFSLAESALNQAVELDPENPQTLTNLAMLQEAVGDNDKALVTWKKIISLGNSAEKTIQLARERANILQQGIVLAEEAKERELSMLTLKRQIIIDSVKTTPENFSADTAVITRDITIKKANNNISVDPGKMKIQLLFCNQLADGRIVTAKIETNFVGANADWADSNPEILHAVYTASKDPETGKKTPMGYLVRVYYNNELQDEKAEPRQLLKIFAATPQKAN
jgi:tetratricopeptide (TPR) repeat protein